MKKLNLAIIGQGRSGRNIHGRFYRTEDNQYFNVKYVVEADDFRRERAKNEYPGCTTFADYTELYALDDIDLVVNDTYSNTHYSITKDLLEHGFNVLVEKPFARTRYECDTLINIAKEKGVLLAVFQQTFFAPFYEFAYDLAKSGKLGEIQQITIRYNGFSRRWDWQTLQKRCAGGLYNTGPHPVGMALGLIDFDKDAKIMFSKLGLALTSGDSDDYAKVLIAAPNGPVVDIEVSNNDAYTPYNLKIQGTKGCFKSTPSDYEMTYLVDGENVERPVVETFLANEAGDPIYCGETLIKHVESGHFDGTAFDVGTAKLYKQIYEYLTEGKPMTVTANMAAEIISVIESVHAANPLPLKF